MRMIALLAIKLPTALPVLALAAVSVLVTVGVFVAGIEGIAGIGTAVYVGPFEKGLLTGVALCLLALPLAVLALAALGGAGRMYRSLVRALLLAPPAPAGSPVPGAAGREPRRPIALDRVLAPGSRDLRRRDGACGHAARVRVASRLDRGRA